LVKRNLEPILKTLHTLGLNIPVIVVTINKTESKELIGFDLKDSENLMPYSGTILKVGANRNTCYSTTPVTMQHLHKPAQKGISFPGEDFILSCTLKQHVG
jgi:hypothetical protein